MTKSDDLEVIAVKYGTMETSRSHQFYRYGAYGQADAPLRMDYFFWILRGGGETILVDTGYHPDAIAHRPGRVCLVSPVDALRSLGIATDEVSTVIVTHFHFDHTGNLSAFPDARLVVQRKEYDFWTGPHAARPAVAASVEASEIGFLAEAAAAGHVDLIDGDHQVTDGVRATLVGGHCPGQQVVTVDGEQPVVLCSDALHFHEEMERYMPFNVLFDIEEMYQAYDKFNGWERDGSLVIAGHDPLVMEQFPALPGADGLAVRIR